MVITGFKSCDVIISMFFCLHLLLKSYRELRRVVDGSGCFKTSCIWSWMVAEHFQVVEDGSGWAVDGCGWLGMSLVGCGWL
jgi:hypothetical protein